MILGVDLEEVREEKGGKNRSVKKWMCDEAAAADLGARPVLHLDQNLSRTHLGQLTDAVVPQPEFSCHMTHSDERRSGKLLAGRGRALPGVSQ